MLTSPHPRTRVLPQAWENHTKIAQQLRDLTVPLDADFLQHTPFHAASPAELIRFTTYPALAVDPAFGFRCVVPWCGTVRRSPR